MSDDATKKRFEKLINKLNGEPDTLSTGKIKVFDKENDLNNQYTYMDTDGNPTRNSTPLNDKDVKDVKNAIDILSLELEEERSYLSYSTRDSIYGPRKKFKVNESPIEERFITDRYREDLMMAVETLNKHVGFINSDINKKMRALAEKKDELEPSKQSSETLLSYPLAGGFSGEFEAIKNIHKIERNVSEMTGGANTWAPFFSPAASSRATTFRKFANTYIKELKVKGQALAGTDKKIIFNAIDKLEKDERSLYSQLELLKKYTALVDKHKDTQDVAIRKQLEENSVEEFVGKYMKTLRKTNRRADKLWVVMESIGTQLHPQ